jgi:hypothetical protein
MYDVTPQIYDVAPLWPPCTHWHWCCTTWCHASSAGDVTTVKTECPVTTRHAALIYAIHCCCCCCCCCCFAWQVLEVMWDDDVALCLTPQAFSNIHPTADIWNNINVQVRSIRLPTASLARHHGKVQRLMPHVGQLCRCVWAHTYC